MLSHSLGMNCKKLVCDLLLDGHYLGLSFALNLFFLKTKNYIYIYIYICP